VSASPPLVLVTVGSDHHPFDRLVEWSEDWFARRAEGSARCFVQYGTSRPPGVAAGEAFVPHDRMQALMREAAVIVTQGGPMSIVEARGAGRVPIVVPRQSSLGEHVDDHQQAFCRRLAAEGLIRVPHSGAEAAALIDAALERPGEFAADEDREATARVAATASRIGALVDQLVAPAVSRPRVLLIAGSGRSGSTLFERALGDVAGVTALGETVHLWERGLRDDELCGCGEPFSRCGFWSAVGGVAFGGWRALPPHEMVELRHDIVRTRYIPRMLGPSRDVGWRLRRDRLARHVGAIYRAVAETTGAQLIVDSSKMPAYAALLRHAGVDLRCVYVVRDPRGVAHSLAKTVTRPEVTNGSATMARYGAAESALWWSTFDATFALMARAGVPLITVRYEDFVRDPRSWTARTLDFAGAPADEEGLSHITSERVRLSRCHLVAGNPMRFRTGDITLARDEAWRVDMPVKDRRLVTALTAGFRRRHGYH